MPTAKAMSVAIGTPQPTIEGWPEVEPGVDGRRHQHAAERPRDRQGGALPAGELADQQLALDLEADDEEEHRHQAVVDPVGEREAEAEGARVTPASTCRMRP
jgi:hypothetical protein